MRADATLCAGLGLLIAMAADPLSRLSRPVGDVGVDRRRRAGASTAPRSTCWPRRRASGAIGVGIVVANVVFAVVAVGGPGRGRAAADRGGRRHDARDRRGHARAAPTPSTSECAVWRDSLANRCAAARRKRLRRAARTGLTSPLDHPTKKGSSMTATTAIPTTTARDAFLRFAMRLDAVLSGLAGIGRRRVRAPRSPRCPAPPPRSSTRWAPSSSSTASPCSCCPGCRRVRKAGHRRDRRQPALHRRLRSSWCWPTSCR